ncbi:hypothetical protein N431DRAFT_455990 [Stipitochalara longipes BDJ]|nr:hypothetical protein N431DRAFT_455990 [Stipitochalara longipes BDJ]
MPAGLQWKGFSRKPKGKVVESTTSFRSGGAQNDSEDVNAFGLFPLHPQDENRHAGGSVPRGNTESEATRPYNADTIAIHGLGGTAYKTWTHENGILCLRDIVRNKLPGVRIYTFGYDSGFAFSKGTGTLRDFAKNLLEAIRLERITPEAASQMLGQSLPANEFLVCHSMGGIVAKLLHSWPQAV